MKSKRGLCGGRTLESEGASGLLRSVSKPDKRLSFPVAVERKEAMCTQRSAAVWRAVLVKLLQVVLATRILLAVRNKASN